MALTLLWCAQIKDVPMLESGTIWSLDADKQVASSVRD